MPSECQMPILICMVMLVENWSASVIIQHGPVQDPASNALSPHNTALTEYSLRMIGAWGALTKYVIVREWHASYIWYSGCPCQVKT